MPRVSTEEVLYSRSISEIVCSLAGTSETDRARAGWNASLQAVAASALQGRSSVRRTETADASAPCAIAAHVECRRAIPAGGYRSELETDGALPRSAQSSTTPDSLRSKAELGGEGASAIENQTQSSKMLMNHPCPPVFQQLHPFVSNKNCDFQTPESKHLRDTWY
jgi:hypothetical protein